MATQHAGLKRLRSPLDGFIVDGFNFCEAGVRHYLLTHSHSDHTCGLHASFDLGTIYCSSTTARIIRATLGVQPKILVTVDVGESIEVEGTRITALDAGHCPGSLLFLMEHLSTGHVALHTGDCRASPDVLEAVRVELATPRPHRRLAAPPSTPAPAWRSDPGTSAAPPPGGNRQRKRPLGSLEPADAEAAPPTAGGPASPTTPAAEAAAASPGLSATLPVDVLYLDTTYSNPRWTFPPQPRALQTLADVTRAEKARVPNTLFIVGSYAVGKEKAIEAVARAAGGRALVSGRRALALRLCGLWDDSLHTEDESLDDIVVHVMPLSGGVDAHASMAALLERIGGKFAAAVTFRPTGWEYSKAYRERVEGGKGAAEEAEEVEAEAGGANGNGLAASTAATSHAHPSSAAAFAAAAASSSSSSSSSAAACFASLPRAWIENEGRTRSYGVPYSEHSSWTELQALVNLLRPRSLVPTVNADTREAREKLLSQYVGKMDLSADKTRLDWFFRHKANDAASPQGQANSQQGQAQARSQQGDSQAMQLGAAPLGLAKWASPVAGPAASPLERLLASDAKEQQRRWLQLTKGRGASPGGDGGVSGGNGGGNGVKLEAPPTPADAAPPPRALCSTSTATVASEVKLDSQASASASALPALLELLGPGAPLRYARALLADAHGDLSTAAAVHFGANGGAFPRESADEPDETAPAAGAAVVSGAGAEEAGRERKRRVAEARPSYVALEEEADCEAEEEELSLPPGSVAWVLEPARGKSYSLYKSRAALEARLTALGSLVLAKGSRLAKTEVTLVVIPEGAESGSVATSLCPGARVVRESWVARRSLALKAGRLPAPPPPPAAAAVAAAAKLGGSKRAREACAAGGSSKAGGADAPLGAGEIRTGTGVAANGEKRGARERSHSAASRARTERALSERLYLLERRDVSSSSQSGMVALKHEFAVLGSTGNVYHTSVCRLPGCSCVDFSERGAICKHLLFVYLKVLRVPRASTLPLQKALLRTELALALLGPRQAVATQPTFSVAPVPEDAVASAELRQAYAAQRASTAPAAPVGTLLPLAAAEAPLPWVEPRPLLGEDGEAELCLVCFDPLTAGSPAAEIMHLVAQAMRAPGAAGEARGQSAVGVSSAPPRPATTHCAHGCGRSYHAACILRWRAARPPPLQCPACRARWRADEPDVGPVPPARCEGAGAEGFLNLALQGTPQARDTSTYSEWLQVHQRRREREEMVAGSPSADKSDTKGRGGGAGRGRGKGRGARGRK